MKSVVRLNRCVVGTALLAALLSTASVHAQNYKNQGIADVVEAADSLLRSGDFAGAISPLQEIISRMQEMTTPSGRETLQNSRFQLARCYFQIGDSARGMEVLETYLKEEPRKDERLAVRMMAQGYLEKEDWEKAAEYASRLLAMGGLSDDDIMVANLLTGQCYYRQKKWAEAVQPLLYVTRNTDDPKILKMSQIMAVQALMETQQWARLYGLVRIIYRSQSKYDIMLNITTMQAGKTLFEGAELKDSDEARDDLLNALFLYRLVLPRNVLADYSTRQMQQLQNELARKMRIGIDPAEQKRLETEIEEIKKSIEELEELPPYEDEVTFRIGQIYAEVKRYWEAYALFDSLYEKDRTGEMGEASVLQSVLLLYEMNETERAEERVLRYLDEQPEGIYVRTLLALAMRNSIENGDPAKVVSLRPYVDRLAPTTDKDEFRLQGELHYMLAFGYLQTYDFKNASGQFDIIIAEHKESPMYSEAVYFRGLALMFQSNYAASLEDFKTYQQQGPTAEHYADSIFREGIALFGMERIPEAEAAMTRFINEYPEDPMVSEAYSLRGDIEAAKDGSDNPDTPDIDEYDPYTLDRALENYELAMKSYRQPSQADYAVFQAARVYKLESRWQEIIDWMDRYLNFMGDKADVAEAVYWKGQAMIQMKQIDQAVDAYIEAIEEFGNDPQQPGVDKMVMELVRIADLYLSDRDRQALVSRISRRVNEIGDEQVVLRLRLRVAKAYMEDEEAAAALGVELLNENLDPALATPISLGLMCDAAVMSGDAEQMNSLYDYFKLNYPDAEEAWHAYRAKTYQQMGAKDYAGALETIEEAQGIYGPMSFMGWAQFYRGKALYELGQYKAAEESYYAIMGVPEWKGSLYAEATMGMAACRLALQDYETAHNFFQRAYMLYQGYDNGKWAAEGYLGAADCLVQLGRYSDAVNTLNAMLEDVYVNTLPQADTARELIKKYGGR